MSNRALVWAIAQTLPPRQKLVLLLLGRHAGDDRSCWPSYATLAKEAGISRRTVIKDIAALIQAGFLNSESRRRTNGSWSSNRYVLLLDGVRADGDEEAAPPGEHSAPVVVHAGAPDSDGDDTSINRNSLKDIEPEIEKGDRYGKHARNFGEDATKGRDRRPDWARYSS